MVLNGSMNPTREKNKYLDSLQLELFNKMLQIKPTFDCESACPYCSSALKPIDTLWMGMHTLVKSECCGCHAKIIEDLKVSHALFSEPNKIDLERGTIFSRGLGTPPLLENLRDRGVPDCEIKKDVLKKFNRVIILNCVDYLYGHCLLKLLNIQRYLEDFPDYGVIAIVPQVTPLDDSRRRC